MTDLERNVNINMSAIPVAGIGGLGLVAIAVVAAITLPEATWMTILGLAGGLILAVALVMWRHGLSTHGPSGSDPTILFRSPVESESRSATGRNAHRDCSRTAVPA